MKLKRLLQPPTRGGRAGEPPRAQTPRNGCAPWTTRHSSAATEASFRPCRGERPRLHQALRSEKRIRPSCSLASGVAEGGGPPAAGPLGCFGNSFPPDRCLRRASPASPAARRRGGDFSLNAADTPSAANGRGYIRTFAVHGRGGNGDPGRRGGDSAFS